MLHLDTRIHFDKVWIVVCINQELQSTCIAVANCLGKADCRVKNNLTGLIRDRKCRCILYHFLMPALYGTVTVIQMNDISVIIT